MKKREIEVLNFSPEKFRAMVAKKNVRYSDLASFCGVTKQTVSTYAQGRSTPDANTFLRIVTYLDTDIEDLTDSHFETVNVPEMEEVI